MSLRARLKRLQRDARGDADYLELQDGTRYYFQPMAARIALFLEEMNNFHAIYTPDLSEGASHAEPEPPPVPPASPPPEIRKALAKATPASLRRFEERYGRAERDCAVIHNDGSVTIRHIALDGSASTRELEGAEAQEYREQTRH